MLSAVHRAAQEALAAQLNRDRLIREAHAQGASLRKIAEAAGMSHEKVRGLISKDQASGS